MARPQIRFVCTLWIAALALLGTPTARAQTLDQQRHLFELGVSVGGTYHPAPNLLFEGDRSRELDRVAAEVGVRLGYLIVGGFGFELEATLIPTTATTGKWATMSAVRAHAILQYPLRYGFAPFVVLGGGYLAVSSNREKGVGNDIDGALHYGIGLKYYITHTLMVRLDLRHSIHARLLDDQTGHRFEILAGFSYVFGWRSKAQLSDKDGDGVVDAQDKCPKVAADTPTGCPADADRDGVPDGKDKCPKVAAKTPTGCPAVKKPDATVTDGDGDGVPDARDKCPKVAAKTANGCATDHDEDGVPDHKDRCPRVAAKTADGCPTDGDGDGVANAKDKCPKVAAKTADGCPADTDRDGFTDGRDKCPKKAETKNGYLDRDGCPDRYPRALKRILGVLRGVGFKRKKTVLRRRTLRRLKRVAVTLKKYPSVRVQIRAHTDNKGDSEGNLALTRSQALAIKAQLTTLGVAASRLLTQGVGALEPRASNKRRAGRAKNRRVELKIIVNP